MDVMSLKNLDLAFKEKLKIRPIISMLNDSSDFQHILDGKDGSKYSKNSMQKRLDW